MVFTVAETLAQAIQYHASGQLTVAEQMYAAVLEKEPNHVLALHWLGLMAHERGDQVLAVKCLSRVAECNRADASAWNNLGVLHIRIGNLDAAIAALEQAVRIRQDFAEAYKNLSVALQSKGEFDRAIVASRQAIQYMPNHAEAYDTLGTALRCQGKGEEALAAYRKAVAISPDFADVINNMGITLQEMGELLRAQECFGRALCLRPDHADFSNNLATALKEMGSLEESVKQYRETLRLRPYHAMAYYNLSQFAAEGKYRFSAEELDRLKSHLATGCGSATERSLFCFTLACVLDRQGSFDEAFRYYRQANDLQLKHYQERNQAFDAARHRTFVDQLIAIFDQSFFDRVKGWGSSSEVPVFVIGMPRSGSTLVEQILGSHPQVFGVGERGDLSQILERGKKVMHGVQVGTKDQERTSLLLEDPSAARSLANEYLQRILRIGGTATRVIDKTLENYTNLGIIATLFPRARIIYCRRDPLDVCLSCYCRHFQHLNFTSSLESLGTFYCLFEHLMTHWRRVLPLPIHEVHNEDLIRHPEAVTRKLLAFCGLDWDERCLTYYDNRRAVRTASSLQVRKPLTSESIGRWKHYCSHLEPLMKALGSLAQSETISASPSMDH